MTKGRDKHLHCTRWLFVGGDAHIAPLSTTEFAEDFHKTGACRRVDVGIDPYEPPGKFQKNRRGGRPCPPLGSHEFAVAFHKNSFFCGRTEASAPTRLPEVRGNCERCRQNVFDVTKENSL